MVSCSMDVFVKEYTIVNKYNGAVKKSDVVSVSAPKSWRLKDKYELKKAKVKEFLDTINSIQGDLKKALELEDQGFIVNPIQYVVENGFKSSLWAMGDKIVL